ncbi:MAG: hypothetical protein RBT39_07450 [Azoarcus sp.]|jgi:hypothetical protein|nr:hypothetical protein [Azoarcus sp.]
MNSLPPKTESVFATLPSVLQTIDGTLTMPTDDDEFAIIAFGGFRYLIALGFMRCQPALALLYDLDIVHLGTRDGSRLTDFRIYVRLKERVRAGIDHTAAVKMIASALALPAAIAASAEQWSLLFPQVQQQMQNELPQCPPSIRFILHPAPEKPNPFHGGGHSFSL